MTNRDPYNDPIRNPDDPWHREWGTGSTGSGSMLIGFVAIVIIVVMIAYGGSRTEVNKATGPSSTISQLNTAGQGGAPATNKIAR